MNLINTRNIAVVLIAGLLTLATAENSAGEIRPDLDETLRAEVLQELKENVRRLYEGDWLAVSVGNGKIPGAPAIRTGFPIIERGHGVAVRYPERLGAFN